jgi:hypothetical protein
VANLTHMDQVLDSMKAVAEIGHLQAIFQKTGKVGVPGVIEYVNENDDFSKGLREGLALAHFYAKEALRRIAANSGMVVVVDPESLEDIQDVMEHMEEECGFLPDEFEDYLLAEHGMQFGDVVICQALMEV